MIVCGFIRRHSAGLAAIGFVGCLLSAGRLRMILIEINKFRGVSVTRAIIVPVV